MSQVKALPAIPRAHTFSIIAIDRQAGLMGVGVQSHWFSVGSRVAWAEPGVGVVATQAMVEVGYGPRGLEAMRAGKTPAEALSALLAADAQREVRQVAMLAVNSPAAAHTGSLCIADAGHICEADFSVQANMMANPSVWGAMAAAFRAAKGGLAGRMLAAMQAAQEAGGDIRGQQSSALLIVRTSASARPWEDRLVDLRVEDHPEPTIELTRLVQVAEAYDLMDQGDQHISRGETEAAMQVYRQAAGMAPHIAELPFWEAVTLADLGHLELALPIFRQVFTRDPNLVELVRRLIPAGILHVTPEVLEKICAQG